MCIHILETIISILTQWSSLMFADVSVSLDSESAVSHSSSWPLTPLSPTCRCLSLESAYVALVTDTLSESLPVWDALSQDSHRKLHPNPSLFVLAQTEMHGGLVETALLYLLIICKQNNIAQSKHNQMLPGVFFSLCFLAKQNPHLPPSQSCEKKWL